MTAATLSAPTDWRDFFALTKPRVMSLVIFTGLCGMLAAPTQIDPILAFTAILCIAIGAGGAAALNQWWEADLDAGMKRHPGATLARRADGTHLGARFRDGPVVRLGIGDGPGDRLAGGCDPGVVDRLLRGDLYRLAQAAHPAEHRYRRRCGPRFRR